MDQLLGVKDLLIFGSLKMHNRDVTKFHHYRLIKTTRKSHFNKRTIFTRPVTSPNFYLEQKHVNEVLKDVGVKVFLVLVNNLAKYILSSVYVTDKFSFLQSGNFYNLEPPL